MAVAAEVVAGKVYQHHVLCIFFGVVLQVPGICSILFRISGTLGSARRWDLYRHGGLQCGSAFREKSRRYGNRRNQSKTDMEMG